MLVSSGVLITQFGIGGEYSATQFQQDIQSPAYATVSQFGHTIINTIIVTENVSLRGYAEGTQLWMASAFTTAHIGANTVFFIGNSLKKAVTETIAIAPVIYLKGIYVVGNSIAYLGIKSVSTNSMANIGFIDFLSKNTPSK